MCNLPPAPSPTMPTAPGCYKNDMGQGWVEVPCDCALWMENTRPVEITASIVLGVTPPEDAPTLDGSVDDEIAFDDPDASFYAVWSKQSGIGTALGVTHDGGVTTVRMGVPSLTLLPVPIEACKTRKAAAKVDGPNDAKLSIHAVLEDGTPFTTTDVICFNPPPV
jgi:hypothetical protein